MPGRGLIGEGGGVTVRDRHEAKRYGRMAACAAACRRLPLEEDGGIGEGHLSLPHGREGEGLIALLLPRL